ncbi:MAG: class I SAM-dependent methyltransferase [Lautropia sp.]|nr:class I SAM-dependent methyltransferase [Lautropia sp.]
MTNDMATRTADPSPGYLNDVAYPAHFHRETMPGWLVAAATALGHQAPALDQPFTWLDVGCGAGLGTLVAAAAHPHAHFVGIDISAREIDEATRLAREAGLDNVRFVCIDIRQLLPADPAPPLAQGSAQTHATPAPPHHAQPHLRPRSPGSGHGQDHGLPPQPLPAHALPATCDFIVCHGVYSWVDDETRRALRWLCQHHLKPGGLAYLAYNSQPGAAAFAAAQRFLRLSTSRLAGNSATRVRAGIQTLQQMAAHGAGFFTEHPAALREMQRLGQFDDAYLAHELLNEHWHAHHVGDVITDMQEEAACQYLGSATLIENIDAVSIPAKLQEMLRGLQQQGASQTELETFRDLARNQTLRRDIYQRQPTPNDTSPFMLDPDSHRQALLAQRVGLMPGKQVPQTANGQLVLDTRIGPVSLPMNQVHPLLHALTHGSRSYADLARLPTYTPNPGFINQLLQVLTWAGWVHYLPPPPDASGSLATTTGQNPNAHQAADTGPAPATSSTKPSDPGPRPSHPPASASASASPLACKRCFSASASASAEQHVIRAQRLATTLASAGHGHWQIFPQLGTALPVAP